MDTEPPECPVCLQPYNTTITIPRVLNCGHTTCQECLSTLHNHHLSSASSAVSATTLRCPSCTHLIPFPSLGPSSLPKNIDLLRFSLSNPTPSSSPIRRRLNPPFYSFSPHHHLYSSWKDWVLPYDAVSKCDYGEKLGGGGVVGGNDLSEIIQCRLVENQEVGFVRIGFFESGDSGLEYGYVGKIMSVLGKMGDTLRDEIKSTLGFSLRNSRVCNVLGLWLDDDNGENHGVLYLIIVKLRNGLSNFGHLFEWSNLGLIGVELCECLMSLHLEGVLCGCLSLSCICFDEFGHVCIDLGEVLSIGGKFREYVIEGLGKKDESEGESVIVKMSNMGSFVAPEMVLELLQWEGFELENYTSREFGCESDVWLLACVLIRLLIGNQFSVEMYNYMRPVFQGDNEGFNGCKDLYLQWVETIKALLQPLMVHDYASDYEMLIRCLEFDPKNRPLVTDFWKCMKGLNLNHFSEHVPRLNRKLSKDKGFNCLLFGELCNMLNDRRQDSRVSKLLEEQDCKVADLGLTRKDGIGDIVKGLSKGKVQCKNLQGHLDCITGFCVGGGFLFSSSYDKTINVWSLQDFKLVHTFRGHENRVMALTFVNEEKPLCISGDNGGGIFVWEINEPFSKEPLKKWFEEKDWRYSGIHAITVSESGCLYTGSGDRLIKAWSLRDYTLICTMEGHKSVVSTLTLSNGVLYSGSWDGTVRLWSLHDRSPLAIFGEDNRGTVSSVLSLYADQNMMIAAYENGCLKIWVDDVLKISTKIHDKAIFSLAMEGKWLFTGGWDRSVKFQELTGDGFDMNIVEVGSFTCDSVVTALLCEQGSLFVGCANKLIKVYH